MREVGPENPTTPTTLPAVNTVGYPRLIRKVDLMERSHKGTDLISLTDVKMEPVLCRYQLSILEDHRFDREEVVERGAGPHGLEELTNKRGPIYLRRKRTPG